MKIDFIEIQNYKAFKDIKLTFDNNNTFLAGANNAGKTSLLEYISLILNGGSELKEDDIPVDEKSEWLESFCAHAADIVNKSKDVNEFSVNINKYFNGFYSNEFSELNLPIIMIQVSYTEKEDISLFAPFIMELDENLRIFNFKIKYQLNKNIFIKGIVGLYAKLKESVVNSDVPFFIKDRFDIDFQLIKHYLLSTNIKYFYTNHTFDDNLCNIISASEFISLFNCKYESANRYLDDNRSDENKFLSSKIIDSISDIPDFDKQTNSLAIKISDYMNSPEFKKVMETWSTNEINKNIKSIKNDLKNNNVQEIKLSYNVMQENINSLLKKVVGAKFVYDNKYELREYSQGLGFSNYIFICLCLQIFKKNTNHKQINVLLVEEPESHMHPQMQRSFLSYIENYTQNSSFQILISTHSTEFIKQINIRKVRVLKKNNNIKSEIFDLEEFYESLSDEEEKRFYSTAFRINLADCIFAEKCIVFEGDCEKLLLTKALQLHDYKSLGNSYVSLLQVGNAYTFQYYKFLKFIKLKTLYICDIDYEIKKDNKKEIIGPYEIYQIKKSQTTNQSIKEFYCLKFSKCLNNCNELYCWDGVIDDYTKIIYQGIKDGYGRTLEEAIFYKLFDMSVFSKFSKGYIKSLKNKMKLNLVVSNKNIIKSHELLESNNDNKVNFILSLIFGGVIIKSIPNYIKEGLKWLSKN